MVDRRERIAMRLALALLLAAAVVFRVWGTLQEPFWLDEAYSGYTAGKSWAFIWHVVPRYETHPPFYYSLLRAWTLLVGDTLLAMRALGIICGIATLPVLLLCGREIARTLHFDRARRMGMALAVAALGALSPVLVEMSREVRPYPVLILAYALAILALLRIRRRTAKGGALAGRAYALYLATLAVILWLHTLGPLFAVALGLALIAMIGGRRLSRGDWLWLAGGHALVALAYLPALAIALDQAPTWVRSTWLRFAFQGLLPRIALLYALPGALAALAAAILATAGLAVLVRRENEGRRIAIALLVAGILPLAASISISALVAPVFIPRTMTPLAVPAILLFGAGASAAPGIWRWPAFAAVVALAAQFFAADVLARERGPQQDWYTAVRWLAARHQPGDVVLAYPNEGALPFDFAVRDLGLVLPSRPIPTAVPSIGVGGWNPTGSRGVVSLPRDRLRAIAADPAIRAAPTVWLLRLGANAYDKGNMFLAELGAGRRQVARFEKNPISLIGLRRATAPRAARAGAAAAR